MCSYNKLLLVDEALFKPIMQSPSNHFLREINTDFDRIIAMCKNWRVLASVIAVVLTSQFL